MRVVESNVQLKSEREASSRMEVKSHFTQRFSKVLESQEKIQDSRERLVKMLESLVEAILSAVEGKNCRFRENDFRPPAVPVRDVRGRGERNIEWRGELTTIRFETECTTVEGAGTVRTADGRCIAFDLSMNMERSAQIESSDIHEGKTVLKDPLVINFNGAGTALSGQRIDFDLNADGQMEQIPGLVSGSGYLVFDRNHNGRVDNGAELFGVASGDGFADLAILDSDQSGWIDEGDANFKDLYIWNGSDPTAALQSLRSADIGALWTGSVSSTFALKDNANALLGEIRGTGIWLRETTGNAGTLQQVDLALKETQVPRET
ncbi:MAG: hypothetical protein ACM3SV_09795 [Betaproteobacteria bacterium]